MNAPTHPNPQGTAAATRLVDEVGALAVMVLLVNDDGSVELCGSTRRMDMAALRTIAARTCKTAQTAVRDAENAARVIKQN